jgi:hypothetical protein
LLGVCELGEVGGLLDLPLPSAAMGDRVGHFL